MEIFKLERSPMGANNLLVVWKGHQFTIDILSHYHLQHATLVKNALFASSISIYIREVCHIHARGTGQNRRATRLYIRETCFLVIFSILHY